MESVLQNQSRWSFSGAVVVLFAILLSGTSVFAQNCNSRIAYWNLEACSAGSSYSEFTANTLAASGMTSVNAAILSNSGSHSCTPSENGVGVCHSIKTGCSWSDNHSNAYRFSVTINPNNDKTATLSKLTFKEAAPLRYTWTNGGSGDNDPPSKYGIRVTLDGQEIFQQTEIATTADWTLESFDFSNDPDFTISSTKTFNFELLGYCRSNGTSGQTVWDIDEIKVFGCATAQCDNVTDGGQIAGEESQCGSYDPAPITSAQTPSGGSGDIEYLWLSSTSGCPTQITQEIPGATSATYDPGVITQTTWYVRCSRRAGCDVWTAGESNCIKKEVTPGQTPGTSCDDGDSNTENDVIQSDGCTCAGTPVPSGCQAYKITDSDPTCSPFASYEPGVFYRRNCGDNFEVWKAGSDLKLIEDSGTAQMTGTIHSGGSTGIVDISFSGYATSGQVWNNSCYNAGLSPQYYYTSFSGTVTVGNTVYTIIQKAGGQDVVLGEGANMESDNDFSFGGWADGTWGNCIEFFGNLTPQNPGDTCDDGNPNTINDVVQANCTCAGTPVTACAVSIDITNKVCNDQGTPSDPADDTYTFDVTVYRTGGASNSYTGSYSNAFLGVFQFSGAYNTPVTLGPFPAGTFTSSNTVPPITVTDGLDIDVSVSDSGNNNCSDNVTVTSTGPCSDDQGGCNTSISVDGNKITINNITGAITAVKVLTQSYATVFSCDDWTTPCNTMEMVTVPGAGTYFVQVQTYADWSTPICNLFETVVVTGGNPCTGNGGDADGDGICANQDCDDNNANIGGVGSSCDDGNPNTNNDIYDANCNCNGTPITGPCANNGGDADGDGICADVDCDDNSAGVGGPGSSCDDGNPNTSNDVRDANCNCVGTPVSTNCDVTVEVNGDAIKISNIVAPITSVQVIDAGWNVIFECNDWTTACNAMETVSGLADGTYFVQVKTYLDWSTPICDIFETVVVGDGPPPPGPCSITATVSNIVCSSQGTTDPSDDTYCFDVTADIVNDGGWGFTVVGTNVHQAPNGSTATVCGLLINEGAQTFTVRDSDKADCTTTIRVNPPAPCSGNDPCVDKGGDADGDGVCADDDCDDNNANISHPGDSCDDGNPNTNNDVIQSDCSCAGTPVSTTCNVSISVSGNTVTVSGLTDAITSVKIIDQSWNTVASCDDWTTACSATEVFSGLTSGTYYVQVKTYLDWSTPVCDLFETVNVGGGDPCAANGGDADGDGICANQDCNDFDANVGGPGSSCDDGNPNTTNDVYNANCDCVGTNNNPCAQSGGDADGDGVCANFDCDDNNPNIGAVGSSCDDGDANTINDVLDANCNCAGTPNNNTCDVTVTVDGSKITVNNLSGAIKAVKFLSSTWAVLQSCDDWTSACGNMEMFTAPSAGTYYVQVQTYADWSTPICDLFETVTITGNPDPCASEGGDSDGDGVCDNQDCDDNNPNISNPGDACDDGDPNTTNDVIQQNCTCAGTPVSTCDNVTDGGTISGDESNCGSYDAAPITSASLPSGGTGAIEYIWLSSTTGCPTNLSQQIPGASGASYDPGLITQTTYFRRCSRRAGCTEDTDWTSGESNCVVKTVSGDNELVHWDLDQCAAYADAYNFGEFTADYSNACSGVSATTIYRDDPNTYYHSCIDGISGKAMCISGTYVDYYPANSVHTLRFSASFAAGQSVSGLEFYAKSEAQIANIGTTNIMNNNYLEKYAVRVKNNGTIIFESSDNNLSNTGWNLESIALSGAGFTFTTNTTLDFEVVAYQPHDPADNGYDSRAWEIDEVKLLGCCSGGNGPTVCADRNATNATECNNGTNYGVWSDGNYYTISNGKFVEYTDGTAKLTGNADGLGSINISFTGRTSNGTPKFSNCLGQVSTADWYYYSSFTGTIGGLTVSRRGEEFHVGTGANNQNGGEFGASGWWQTAGGQTGDINIRLSGNASACASSTNRVQILGLDATAVKGEVDLTWSNNTGDLNDDFEIQRSEDGVNFETIGLQNSLDDGSRMKFYGARDRHPLTGANFYRVRLNYSDGTFEYSEVRRVTISDIEDFGLFPNPAHETVNVSLKGYEGSDIEIQLIDGFGKRIKAISLNDVSDTSYSVDLTTVQNGIYSIWIFTDGRKPIGKKMIVNKMY